MFCYIDYFILYIKFLNKYVSALIKFYQSIFSELLLVLILRNSIKIYHIIISTVKYKYYNKYYKNIYIL